MHRGIGVGDYVRVKVHRISGKGNAIAPSPRNGYIHVIDGKPGEDVIVKIIKSTPYTGRKVDDIEGINPISFGDYFYERSEEIMNQRYQNEFKKRKSPTKPGVFIMPNCATKPHRLKLNKDDKKSKKQREMENRNRALKNDL
jgi:hypothetical protein